MTLYTIYDIFNKKNLPIAKGNRNVFAKSIGCNPAGLSHLISGKQKSLKDRYILPENKHLIFNFVDNFGNEYPCITNTSLFIHLNVVPSPNDMKYVSAVKLKKQKYMSLNGKIFHIKEHCKQGQYPLRNTKVVTDELRMIRKNNKMKNNLARRLRVRIYKAIKAQLTEKRNSMLALLGITMDQFFLYMESKFTDGMSWENYGKWHVDHIKPCALYDLTLETEQAKCFHYTNLQPLWAYDNHVKGSTFPTSA